MRVKQAIFEIWEGRYGSYICGLIINIYVISVDQNAAKQAAAAATQTIAAAQNAASSNKNPAAQQQLVQSCKVCLNNHFLFLSGPN